MSASTVCLLSCQLRILHITPYIPTIPSLIHTSAIVGTGETPASIHVSLCCKPFVPFISVPSIACVAEFLG